MMRDPVGLPGDVERDRRLRRGPCCRRLVRPDATEQVCAQRLPPVSGPAHDAAAQQPDTAHRTGEEQGGRQRPASDTEYGDVSQAAGQPRSRQRFDEGEQRPAATRGPCATTSQVRSHRLTSSRRRAWTQVIPFFAFPPLIRRVLYTTNVLENLHRQLRKIIKTRGLFPTDEAATKLLWLALRNITLKWAAPAKAWCDAMNHFAILYGDRFTGDA